MKTINAPVAPGSLNSISLAGRRDYSRMDTASLKRHERRKQRHGLRSLLQADLLLGVKDEPIQLAAPVVEEVTVAELPYNVRRLFAVPAADSFVPAPSGAVKVIRKRAFHKPVVEMLQAA